MYSFKGFVSIPSLVNNIDSTVAPIGELSPLSATFSREIKTYTTPAAVCSVLCFKSYSTSANSNVTPPAQISTLAIEVASWVHQRQNGLTAVETVAEFLTAFTAQFGTQLSSVTVPSMTNSISGRSYPTSISWSTSALVNESNLTKLWFSDAAFSSEYDEYELIVVPPIANIDVLVGEYSVATAALSTSNMSDIYTRIQSSSAGKPPTAIVNQSYGLVNTNNTTISTVTQWTVLVYGPRGNNEDLIRAAIVTYLSTNTTGALSKWKAVLPDLFNVTEFIILPQWTKYAVPPRTLTNGVNSQIANISQLLTYVKGVVNYPDGHVDAYLQTVPHVYYNLLLAVIGNPENRSNKYMLTDFFPDIITASTTSAEFGRMSSDTQGFMIHLSNMLVLARTLTLASDIPVTYKKATRNGVLYITVTYQNVTYLVASALS